MLEYIFVSPSMPAPPSIRERLYVLDAQHKKVLEQKKALQAECQHPDKKITGKGNDHDGYSWVEITYYTHFHCPDCDRYWSESHT